MIGFPYPGSLRLLFKKNGLFSWSSVVSLPQDLDLLGLPFLVICLALIFCFHSFETGSHCVDQAGLKPVILQILVMGLS
jgi:hypothetical protein